MPDFKTQIIDVLIVGAGVSGLTAGFKIKQKEQSLNVVIAEAESDVGGQLNYKEPGEIGAKWFTKDQYHIYQLVKDLDIEVNHKLQTNKNYNRCWDIDNGYLSKIRLFEIKRFINKINMLCLNYAPGSYNLKQNMMSMEKYICSKLLFEKSRKYIRAFVRLICGVDSKNISFTEFMSICCTAGGLSNLITLLTGTSNSLLEFSSEEFLKKITLLLEKISTVILKNTKIIEIFHYSNYVIARDDKGELYRTSVIILAIPWNLVNDINIYPPLPHELKTPLINRKYLITSFIATYRDNYWKNYKYSGSYFSLEKPIIICYPYKTTKLAGIILHDNENENIIGANVLSDIIPQSIVLKKLSNCFGDDIQQPINYTEKTFEQNLLLNLPQTTPWNRLIWSSTCAATSYRGYLGGAVQSGLRAAIHALLIIRPQNVNWQDIDEIKKANVIKKKICWYNRILYDFNLRDLLFYSILTITLFSIFKIKHLWWDTVEDWLPTNYFNKNNLKTPFDFDLERIKIS